MSSINIVCVTDPQHLSAERATARLRQPGAVVNRVHVQASSLYFRLSASDRAAMSRGSGATSRHARQWQMFSDNQRAAAHAESLRLHQPPTAHHGRRRAPRRTGAAASKSAAPAIELASRTLGACSWSCGGCGTWLFRATDVDSEECEVMLTDSPTICAPQPTSTRVASGRACAHAAVRGVQALGR